jgi:UDPglucose--hexose-1-phosphate uridylyltransferase
MNSMSHYKYKARCLFCDIIFQELTDNERIIIQNDRFIALAPFASRAPFTVRILPRKHETFFEWNSEFSQLAEILKNILVKISTVLNDPNYVMVLHTGPNIATGKERGFWKTLEKDYHWYIEITPRFRAYTSFEIGSGFQVNMVAPERATKVLKEMDINI